MRTLAHIILVITLTGCVMQMPRGQPPHGPQLHQREQCVVPTPSARDVAHQTPDSVFKHDTEDAQAMNEYYACLRRNPAPPHFPSE